MDKKQLRQHLITIVTILISLTLLGFVYCIAAGHIKTGFLHVEAISLSTSKINIETVPASKITTQDLSIRWPVPCSNHYSNTKRYKGCTPVEGGTCDRLVRDDFLTPNEIQQLIQMADTGMSKAQQKSTSGPTIMDINSGWVLPPGSHQPSSIYGSGQLYTREDYAMYKSVTERLKAVVETTFGATKLFFTAPTFITREIGDKSWKPSTMHDEYWHPHVDKNNTEHYDYSGLIYLSTHGEDFQGGELHFYNHDHLDCSRFVDYDNPGPCVAIGTPDLIVKPRKGRMIVFGSGRENPHRVTRVKEGIRYVLSFWFSCNKRKRFKTFLDGKVHKTFDQMEEL